MRLVYRADQASAVVDRNHLVISVQGAVNSGGWDRPDLWIRSNSFPEERTLEIRFVARPPASNEVVVQTLLPIAVRKTLPLPRYGTAEVEIVTETNTLVVPIMRYRAPAPIPTPRPGSQ